MPLYHKLERRETSKLSTNDKHVLLKGFEEELEQVEDEIDVLERRRSALLNTVEGIRELISLNGGSAPAKPERPRFPRNAFADLGTVEAAVKYLGIVKRPQTTREMVDALILGGKKSESKNYTDMVRITLLKETEKGNPRISWKDHKWELPEWSKEEDDIPQ